MGFVWGYIGIYMGIYASNMTKHTHNWENNYTNIKPSYSHVHLQDTSISSPAQYLLLISLFLFSLPLNPLTVCPAYTKSPAQRELCATRTTSSLLLVELHLVLSTFLPTPALSITSISSWPA
jgi:hypothetical protein